MNALTVGLVGCGHISKTHLAGWRRTRASTVDVVFDVDEAAARETANRFGVGHVAGTIEQLVGLVDVVDVCTPPHTHMEILRTALVAGCDVLAEKPIVTSSAEWEAIEKLLSASGGRLAVVHHLKFSACVERARRWIKEGRIGRILRVDSLFLTSPSHDRMLKGSGHWSHPLPGGRWIETLPHNLYLIHSLAGPHRLSSVAAIRTSEMLPGLAADEVSVTLESEDSIATIHFSAHCRNNTRTATIVGTEGSIRLDFLSNAATLHRLRDGRWTRTIGRSMLEAVSQSAQTLLHRPGALLERAWGVTPHGNLIRAFELQLLGDGPPPTPVDEIDYVVRMCERIGLAIAQRAG